MKSTQKSNLVSGVLILGSLGLVLGIGTFLLLALMGRDILLAILATVGVVALMVGFHFVVWGRSASRGQHATGPQDQGFDVSLSHRDIEQDRAIVQERRDADSSSDMK